MNNFSLSLSSQPAPPPYSEDALLSFNETGAAIHAQTDSFAHRLLQKAARKVSGLGVSNIQFVGEWNDLQQWAFASSFCGVDFCGRIQWAEGSDKQTLEQKLKCLLFAKTLINQSPEDCSPESLAEQTVEWLTQLNEKEVNVKKIVGEDLKQQGFMGIYEVGRGSDRPPVLLEIDYNPTGDPQAAVEFALVGKGITYDSGGYSIKASESMLDMKCDMGGAATLVGALGFAIMQKTRKRIKLFLCCAENLISGHAYKLGDIITYKNGVRAEIVNTDAEGRLVLADGLIAASEVNPKYTVDAATLTGAAIMAVGKEYNAVFGLDDQAVNSFLEHAQTQQELHWRLPLNEWHKEQCPSPFADTANSRPMKGGGAGGASNAAGFLLRFLPEHAKGWVHIDLSAAYHRNGTELMPNGASGQGLTSIAAWLTS